jgi:peptidoglycan/LPS O-acetylase OafA/YrhL
MQGWLTAVDIYCERTDASFWSEPINALTNLAFLFAAGLLWSRAQDQRALRLLAILIGLIGLGSFLFHTFGNRLTGLLDVFFIAAFIVAFAYLLPRVSWHQTRWRAVGAMLIALIFIAGTTALVSSWRATLQWLPPGMYLGAWLILLIYAALSRRLGPSAKVGGSASNFLWLASSLFGVSMIARQLDMPLCSSTGGLHWLWHLFNAAVLWACARAIDRSNQSPQT